MLWAQHFRFFVNVSISYFRITTKWLNFDLFQRGFYILILGNDTFRMRRALFLFFISRKICLTQKREQNVAKICRKRLFVVVPCAIYG